MRSSHAPNTARKLLAAATISGFAVGSALMAVPASAASGTLTYNCTVPVLGAKTFTAVMDTDAPASLASGAATPVLTGLAKVTVPADLVDPMRDVLEAKTIEGSADVKTALDAVEATNGLSIPPTQIPASGPVVLNATGPLYTVTGGAAGASHKITMGNFVAKMFLKKADGSNAGIFTIPCTAAAGQNMLVDTIAVAPVGSPTVPAPGPITVPGTPVPGAPGTAAKSATTTKLKAKVSKKASKAVVKAKVSAADSSSTAGKIKLVLKQKGSKKSKTVSTKVNSSGAAKAVFKKLKKGKYTVKATFAGSNTTNASKGKVSFQVK